MKIQKLPKYRDLWPGVGPNSQWIPSNKLLVSTLNKAQVEKDEGLEVEALPRLLIVAEGPD